MADRAKYGTKAQRLQQCLAHAQAGSGDSPNRHLKLPTIRNSEDAVRLGQHLTPNQYLILEGGRRGIQRMFDVLAFDTRQGGEVKSYVNQLRADYAFQMQMIREAQECAPDATLAALASANDVTFAVDFGEPVTIGPEAAAA